MLGEHPCSSPRLCWVHPRPRRRLRGGEPRPAEEETGPAEVSTRRLSSQRRARCGTGEETASLLTIFNLKMQMLLVSRWLIRAPLCHALTSIRGITRTAPHWHFPSVTVTALAAQMPGCHTEVYHRVFSCECRLISPEITIASLPNL